MIPNHHATKTLFLSLFTVCAHIASAQDFEAIYNKYANEQAVVTNFTEQLVIKNEKGQLVAQSNISKEMMLIGDLSPGIFNKDYIYHSYFNRLEDFDAEGLIPSKKGYEKLDKPSSKTSSSEDNSVFYDDVKQTEISFSGLTPKSLMRTSYTLSYPDLHVLPEYYFEKSVPVSNETFEVTAPKYVNMGFVIRGSHQDLVQKTVTENKNTVTYTFSAQDVPAPKEYDDIPSASWYVLQVIPYIKSYKLPGDDSVNLLRNPDDLYHYMYTFIKNINTKPAPEIDSTVRAITAHDNLPAAKAAKIFSWVQANIHYIAFEDSLEGFIPRQAADIYSRRFGDCKDMASILCAMCRAAGIDAHLTWIGTRTKPYNYEETPLPLVNNHMICAIKLNNHWIFLDATHPLIPFGYNPSTIQGKEAMISLNEHSYEIVHIPETNADLNVKTDTTILNISDNQVTGSIRSYFEGYPSWDIQTLMLYTKAQDEEKLVKGFNSRGSDKYDQKSYKYVVSDTGYRNCMLSAEFSIGDYVQKVNKNYYINLNLNRYFDGHAFDTAGRDVPIYLKYKDHEEEVVILNLPPGFHVDYLPPADSGSVDGVWNYKITYTNTGSKVILTKTYNMLSMSIPVNKFKSHLSLMEKLNKQYNETVVLAVN